MRYKTPDGRNRAEASDSVGDAEGMIDRIAVLRRELGPSSRLGKELAHLADDLTDFAQMFDAVKAANDCINIGVVILSRNLDVVGTNRYMDDILDDDDGLVIRSGRLQALHPSKSKQLQEMIQAQIEPANPVRLNGTDVLAVTRPSGRRSYLLQSVPLDVAVSDEQDAPGVIVFVADPEQHHELNVSGLVSLFGLTMAEARLGALMATGMRIDDASANVGIAPSTGRTHLKRIFSKTNTQRQAEVTHLFLSLLGRVRSR